MKGDLPSTVLHDLQSFRQMGSVLYIAAHPDDENTELLAYLARGRNYRTAYLSLTRGDGGQNVLGPDFGSKLGVARTQELLAARHVDGAQQFFSRAVDFGFSKNYSETLNVWNKQEVLSDVVRVIRQFRPDVVITRFSPEPGGTHGHHTASTVLAEEAFKLAGNANAFPEQGLPPWQPKRLFWNVSTFQKDKIRNTDTLKIDFSGKDPVSGETFADIAGTSRAMHKTQGFDNYKIPSVTGAPRIESFQLLDGERAKVDILDGVDTSWARVPGGGEIGKEIDKIIAQFDANNTLASVPALLKLRAQIDALNSNDSIIKEKRAKLNQIVQECLGLKVETTIAQADVVPGEPMKLQHTVSLAATGPGTIAALKDLKIKWAGVRYPTLKKELPRDRALDVNKEISFDTVATLPTSTLLTQPWWLRTPGTPGLFHTDNPSLIGTAENAPSFPVEEIFEVGGQKLTVADEPVQIIKDASGHAVSRRLDVIPPVSLRFISDIVLLTPGSEKTVAVSVTAARAKAAGTLRLEAPDGWEVSPHQQSFSIEKVGQHQDFKFIVRAPKKVERTSIVASAEINGVRYRNQREEINYPHIPPQLLQPEAILNAVSLDLATSGHTVGYLPGAGDSMPDDLKQMGYTVKILDDAHLTSEDLSGLDAVIVGVRAFNVRPNLAEATPKLFAYIENGGTVIVQYNRPDKLQADKIAPYDLHISADRVTDEKANITFLEPLSPILNKPNKITESDFNGWVQERGLYFPNSWDQHFTPIISLSDPGEAPTQGALLVAQYGKGHYIYTGLAFFRQLPAGVPGAYRLLANMVAIGK